MIQLKVCGIKNSIELKKIDEIIKPKYMGLIFVEESSRKFEEDFCPIRVNSKKVGVFQNADLDYVKSIIHSHKLDLVQLHGTEDDNYCAHLRKHLPVIKAIGINTEDSLQKISKYEGVVDFILLDTSFNGKSGGTGKKFDWKLLINYEFKTPFFLSGGIQSNDGILIRDIVQESLYGVDINSGFEISPGYKNTQLINEFLDDIYRN